MDNESRVIKRIWDRVSAQAKPSREFEEIVALPKLDTYGDIVQWAEQNFSITADDCAMLCLQIFSECGNTEQDLDRIHEAIAVLGYASLRGFNSHVTMDKIANEYLLRNGRSVTVQDVIQYGLPEKTAGF